MDLTKIIYNEITRLVSEISEDEIKKAQANIEQRVREQTVNVAAIVASRMEITPFKENALKIIVEFKP